MLLISSTRHSAALGVGLLLILSTTACSTDESSVRSRQQRIVGGDPITDAARPLAALSREVGGNFEHICSGAFIADDIVLTAAHCFTNLDNGSRDTDTSNLRVCDAFDTDGQNECQNWLEADRIFILPEYFSLDQVGEDWALIHLKTPVTRSSYARISAAANVPNTQRLESSKRNGATILPTSLDGTASITDTSSPILQLNIPGSISTEGGDSGGAIYDVGSPGALDIVSVLSAQSGHGTNLIFWGPVVRILAQQMEADIPGTCNPRFAYNSHQMSDSALLTAERTTMIDVPCVEYRGGEYVGVVYALDGTEVKGPISLDLDPAEFPEPTLETFDEIIKAFIGENFDSSSASSNLVSFAVANENEVAVTRVDTLTQRNTADITPLHEDGTFDGHRKVRLHSAQLDGSPTLDLVVGVDRKHTAYKLEARSTMDEFATFGAIFPAFLNLDPAVDFVTLTRDSADDQLDISLRIRGVLSAPSSNPPFVGGMRLSDDAQVIAENFNATGGDIAMGGGGLLLLCDGYAGLYELTDEGRLEDHNLTGADVWDNTLADPAVDPWTGADLDRNAIDVQAVRTERGRIKELEVLLDDGGIMRAEVDSSSRTRTLSGPFYGLPTPFSADGKFVTLSGEGLATVAATQMRLRVVYPNAKRGEPFSIQIHDPGMGGSYDRGERLVTCASVGADPCGDRNLRGCLGTFEAESPVILGENTFDLASATAFDATWRTLDTGSGHDCAAAIDQSACEADPDYEGTFKYEVRVFLLPPGETTCGDPPGNGVDDQIDVGAINGMKIRADGIVAHAEGDLSFESYDDAGRWAAPFRPYLRDAPYYDGSFTFVVGASWAATEMTLTDTDADDLDEDNDGDDDDFPAEAVGANAEVQYQVLQGGQVIQLHGPDASDSTLVDVASNLSGNCDASVDQDLCSMEERVVQFSPNPNAQTANYEWVFTGLNSMNNIHIRAPHGSPYSFELLSSSLPRPRVTQTRRSDEWSAPTPELDAIVSSSLPILLGREDSSGMLLGDSLRLVSASEVQQLLDSSPLTLKESIEREVLIVELNLALTESRGELLTGGTIYGTQRNVGAVVANAHRAIRGPFGLQNAQEMERLLVLLQAINYGDVTYLQPGFSTPAHPTDDDDADGIINIKDNCIPLWNPHQEDSDMDGVGDACAVQAYVNCVIPRTNGYSAVWDYDNPLAYRTLPLGRRNHFEELPSDQGQPLEFEAGYVERAFRSHFDVSSTWNLEGTSVTADTSSPLCSGFELLDVEGLESVAVFATNNLVVRDQAVVTGDEGSTILSNGYLEIGSLARVDDVWSAGNPWIRSQATLEGDLVASGNANLQTPVNIEGALIESGYVPEHDIDWALAFPSAQPGLMLEPQDPPVALSPGSFGNVTLKSNAQLYLESGVYYFQKLWLEPGAKILLDDSEGPVVIYVSNTLLSRGNILALDGEPNVLIAYFGNQDVYLESDLTASVIAPSAKVVLGSGGPRQFFGAFFAREVEIRSGVTVHYQR